jgi:hypothetical protein
MVVVMFMMSIKIVSGEQSPVERVVDENYGYDTTTTTVGGSVPYPVVYTTFASMNSVNKVTYSGLVGLDPVEGKVISTIFNTTSVAIMPSFLPSAVFTANIGASTFVFRLGNNQTDLCSDNMENYLEIYDVQNVLLSYVQLYGDPTAASAYQFLDAFYNANDSTVYATVYNLGADCAYGNMTSSLVTINPDDGQCAVLITFPVGLVVTAPGRTTFDFETQTAYLLMNNYTHPPTGNNTANNTSYGQVGFYSVDYQDMTLTSLNATNVSSIYQLAFNSQTQAVIWIGLEGNTTSIGRVWVYSESNTASFNVTVPMTWFPLNCGGLGFRRGAFNPTSGFYTVACGGTNPEDNPEKLITFSIHGGPHSVTDIKYPTVMGGMCSIEANLMYLQL